MARGINKVILIGNAGSDAEVRYLPSGGAVANVSLATTESWRDRQTGQMQERTEWHRVAFMDRGNYRLGQIAGEYIKKGSKVYVEGSLRTREWEKDGIKRYTTEIVASEMQLLDSRGDQMGQGGYDAGMSSGYGSPAPQGNAPQSGGFQQGGGFQQPQAPQSGYGQPQQGGFQQPQQSPAPAQQAPQAQPQSFGSWGNPAQQSPSQAPAQQKPAPSQPAPNFDDFDDDIPF